MLQLQSTSIRLIVALKITVSRLWPFPHGRSCLVHAPPTVHFLFKTTKLKCWRNCRGVCVSACRCGVFTQQHKRGKRMPCEGCSFRHQPHRRYPCRAGQVDGSLGSHHQFVTLRSNPVSQAPNTRHGHLDSARRQAIQTFKTVTLIVGDFERARRRVATPVVQLPAVGEKLGGKPCECHTQAHQGRCDKTHTAEKHS